MVVVPARIPDTTPVATLAVVGMLLFQTPPLVASVSVVVSPTHTLGVPVMAAGVSVTVTTWVVAHPVPSVYVINAVPVDTPLTTPVVPPIDIFELVLLHAPPGVASVSILINPVQIWRLPVITDGSGFTVNDFVAEHVALTV